MTVKSELVQAHEQPQDELSVFHVQLKKALGVDSYDSLRPMFYDPYAPVVTEDGTDIVPFYDLVGKVTEAFQEEGYKPKTAVLEEGLLQAMKEMASPDNDQHASHVLDFGKTVLVRVEKTEQMHFHKFPFARRFWED